MNTQTKIFTDITAAALEASLNTWLNTNAINSYNYIDLNITTPKYTAVIIYRLTNRIQTKVLTDTTTAALETAVNAWLNLNAINSFNLVAIKYSNNLGGGSGGGDSIGIAEIPVTFSNVNPNYYARFGALNVLIGNPADFTITPAALPDESDTLKCSKVIIQCYAAYYFQSVTQTGSNRVVASLFGGARSAGGAVSFPLSLNNARISNPVNLGYVAANDPITSSLNFAGNTPLTINSCKLIINYLTATGSGGGGGSTEYTALISYRP